MKYVITLMVLLVVPTLLFSLEPPAKKKVVFVGDPDWMPFEANKKGHYVGMVADILQLIEANSQLQFEYLPTSSWDESLSMIKTSKAQLISQSRDSNFEQGFVFSKSYYKNPIVIVMNNQEQFLRSLYPIANQRIGIIKTMPYFENFKTKYPNIQFVGVKNSLDGLAQLKHHNIDAFVNPLAQTSYSLNKLGLDELRIVGKTPFFTELGFGVTENNIALLKELNSAIEKLSEDDIAIIESKWIRSAKKEKRYICVALGAAFLLVLLIVVIYYKMKIHHLLRRDSVTV